MLRPSFAIVFIIFNIELSFFEDVLIHASPNKLSVIDDERLLVKAMQESIHEQKLKSLKHRRHKRQAGVVCYNDLGCFEDSGPFLDMLPSSPEEIDTKFFVHTTKHRSANPYLEFSFHDISSYSLLNETLSTSNNNATTPNLDKNTLKKNINFKNAKAPLNSTEIYKKFGNLTNASIRIIVHGFGSSCVHEWINEMKSALMAVEECFVICVDWENGASFPNYVRAAANSRLVGKQLAYFLKALQKNNELDYSKVHIIGFSLGAHVSGFCGAELKNISRITGLDPAGPLFEGSHTIARLDDSDAKFVDVIHSNGENLILGGLGSWQPMGHVDFYPNGGRVQIGCSNLFVGAVTDIIWAPPEAAEGRSLCNHRRAYKFFIDSVASRCLFPAFPCNSYEDFLQGNCFKCSTRMEKSSKFLNQSAAIKSESVCGNMGYYADKSTGRGQLYLRTREEEPYCAHQYKLKIESTSNELPLRTLGRIEVELESEGGLTEVFAITDRDDEELFAGDLISKIIVPHPALNFPKIVTITYYVFKGWLSRGISTWGINKIVLSDSFGESYSLCKHLELETGAPIRMTLLPGDCHEHENEKEKLDNSDAIEFELSLIETINISKIATNQTQKPFQALKLNLEKNDTKEFTLNMGEEFPTEKAKTEKRSFSESSPMNAMHVREDSVSKEEISDTVDSDKTSPPVFIQLFPQRLNDIFERAESYARNTLFPLLFSEQITNIFNSNQETAREVTFNSNPIMLSKSDNWNDGDDNNSQENVKSLQAMSLKIVDDILPPFDKLAKSEYSKKSSDSETLEIRIDLPTYKPPLLDNGEKIVIPLQRYD